MRCRCALATGRWPGRALRGRRAVRRWAACFPAARTLYVDEVTLHDRPEDELLHDGGLAPLAAHVRFWQLHRCEALTDAGAAHMSAAHRVCFYEVPGLSGAAFHHLRSAAAVTIYECGLVTDEHLSPF